MKKVLVTLSLVLTLGLGASAQDGFFAYGDAENQNRESGNFSEMPALPLRGQFTDQSAHHDAPVGSGLLILAGLGLAYGLKRRK